MTATINGFAVKIRGVQLPITANGHCLLGAIYFPGGYFLAHVSTP